jgi:SAM-dependent methyltransferase
MSTPPARLANLQRVRSAAARTKAQVLALGVGSGLRPYRPERWSVPRWERAYTTGEFAYLSDVYELPRYSVLVGYLRTYAGTPSVLDIGCGSGRLREEDFTTYSGLDISAEAIRSAMRLADNRTSFVVGDAMTVNLAPADVVLLNEMIYYTPSPRALLRRVAAIVRPGGLVLASIWRHAGDRALWRLLDDELQLVSASRIRAQGNPYNRRGWRVSCHRVRETSSEPATLAGQTRAC